MNYKYLSALLVMTSALYSQEQSVTIDTFEESRDLPAVKKILDEHDSFLRYEAGGYEKGTSEKYIKSPNYISKVLRLDNETIGFINYAVCEKSYLRLRFWSQGFIHLIGVDTEYQSKGYGKQLLRYALKDLKEKGMPTAYLFVKPQNSKAINLYEKEGFTCDMPREYRELMPLPVLFEKEL